jgi:serine/threonine protein kinase
MLDCIEGVHNQGYIHRDIKPSNFVLDLEEKRVYMIDFGLSKLHLDEKGIPFPERKNTEFRGTIAYASINAHNRIVINKFIFLIILF